MSSTDVSITKTSKEQKSLPKGARVLNKSITTKVEEIENGYLICKNIEYKYEVGEGDKIRTDWMYFTKRWYVKEDPLEIKLNSKDKALADSFNED